MSKINELQDLTKSILDDAKSYAEKGKDFVFNAEADEAIYQVMRLKDGIEKTIEAMKAEIEKQGLAYNENFKSVKGDRVKVGYRAYGGLYTIDYKEIEKVSKKFYRVDKRYYPETEEIKKFVEENGALPVGVNERERAKQISISVVGVDDEE